MSLAVVPEGGTGTGKETASSCLRAALETADSPGVAPFLGCVRAGGTGHLFRTGGCAAPVTSHSFRQL